jgi:hypothetical protein
LEDYLPLPGGRQPYHNPNWGGARPGWGRPRLILPETVVDVTPKPEFAKPLDYLWSRMNDPALPAQYRDPTSGQANQTELLAMLSEQVAQGGNRPQNQISAGANWNKICRMAVFFGRRGEPADCSRTAIRSNESEKLALTLTST